MITVIEGRGLGAGKSYMAMELLLSHWAIGGTACVSDSVAVKWQECKEHIRKKYGLLLEDSQYRVIKYEDLTRLHEVTPAGSRELPVLLVVDEAQQAFNARDWNDRGKRAFFDWLCHSRHDCNDVCIISQAAANVDKQVRRLATFYWVVRNSEFFPVLGVSMQTWIRWLSLFLHSGRFFVRTQLDQDGHTKLDRKWVFADSAIFRCYDSLSMRLTHRRAGAVEKLKLATDKKSLDMKGLILICVVIAMLSGCSIYKFWAGRHARPATSPTPSTTAVVGKVSFRDGDTILEAMRCATDGYLQTAKRIYRLGERNDLGLVVGLNMHAAIVQVGPNVRIFVQTFADKNVAPDGAQSGASSSGGSFGFLKPAGGGK